MKILAIETSCDETACAVIEDGTKIISNVVASSTLMHKKYGGIVPEVAAREQLKCIIPVLTEALTPLSQNLSPVNSSIIRITELSQSAKKNTLWLPFRNVIETSVDAIAVTVGPGLIGSLLIGVETAKTIAFVTGKPVIPVNHVLAHMYANFLEHSVIPSEVEGSLANASSNKLRDSSTPLRSAQNDKNMTFPAISLVVSGGHTELFLMKSEKDLTWLGGTLDDAAGEAFDKTARLLGFENRGGPAIAEAAKKIAPSYSSSESSSTNREVINTSSRLRSNKITLPRPMMHDDSLNFSFSGLKTAIVREWNKYTNVISRSEATRNPTDTQNPNGISHSVRDDMVNVLAHEVQEAITDVLVAKTLKAAQLHNAQSILISGGVSANTRLREKFIKTINHELLTINFFVPPSSLCTDNAAYIASYAYFRGKPVDWHDIAAVPDLSAEEITI